MKRPKQEDYPGTMHRVGYNDYVSALEKYCDQLEKENKKADSMPNIIISTKIEIKPDLKIGYIAM